MMVDEQVESRLRAAYGAAIAKRADDVTAALDGITHEQSMSLIGLGLYVVGYVVNDIHRDKPNERDVRGLATEIVNAEIDWIDLGGADLVASFLNAAAAGDAAAIGRLGAEEATGLVIVTGGHLLAHYRQENERWFRYLDAILETYETVTPAGSAG